MAAPAAKAQDPFAIGPSCYGFGGRRVPGRRRLHGLLDVCPSMPCPVDLPFFPHAASCMRVCTGGHVLRGQELANAVDLGQDSFVYFFT